jgi:uncharacterized RDD family membrane protein YckC
MARQLIETKETLIIETPERVPLEFALASIGNRFIAVAIDHFLQFFAILLISYIAGSMSGPMSGLGATDYSISELSKWTVAILVVAMFVVFASYFVLFEWLWNGQTPGKRWMKLRVIREDGRPLTLWEAATRNLIRICDAAPGFVVPIYSVGLITIFLSNRDQRLGDIFAGTVVIRERTDEAPTFAETFSNPVSDTAFSRVQKRVDTNADVTKLSNDEIEVVESFLRRRWDLTERQRLWMAWRVALPLMYRLKPNYNVDDFTYEGFLEEILHKFHARQRFLN